MMESFSESVYRNACFGGHQISFVNQELKGDKGKSWTKVAQTWK